MSNSAARKQKSRDKLKKFGVKVVELHLNSAELAILDIAVVLRGGVRVVSIFLR